MKTESLSPTFADTTHASVRGRSRPVAHQASGRTFQVDWESRDAAPDWDAFVESFPDGHHEQTSLWGQVRKRHGWNIGRIIVRSADGGDIVAGVQVMSRRLGHFGRGAYITYGPCVAPGTPEATAVVLGELKAYAQSIGARLMVLGLPYDAHGIVPGVEAAGFLRKPTRFPPRFMEATCTLDLGQPLDSILGHLRPSTRRNVRTAQKKGIRVEQGGGADIALFHSLMLQLCRRRGVSPNPPEPDFFQQLWQRFEPRGWMRIYLARRGDETISAAVAFTFRDWFRVWKVGWSGEHADLRPNEGLWWGLIQEAALGGYRQFDFVDLDPEVAHAVLGGTPREAVGNTVATFKLGFGPTVRLLPGAYLHFPNPLLRVFARTGIIRALASPALSEWLGRFRGASSGAKS